MTDEIQADEQLWQELLDYGAMDKALIAEFKCVVLERPWKPLGRILLDEGLLSLRQISGLLQIQAEEPGMRIGDLAVREEYCTPDQIEAALHLQRESSPGPVELLLRDSRVSNDALTNALVGYIHHLEGAVHNLRAERAKTGRS